MNAELALMEQLLVSVPGVDHVEALAGQREPVVCCLLQLCPQLQPLLPLCWTQQPPNTGNDESWVKYMLCHNLKINNRSKKV
jgi:hypothetical protein